MSEVKCSYTLNSHVCAGVVRECIRVKGQGNYSENRVLCERAVEQGVGHYAPVEPEPSSEVDDFFDKLPQSTVTPGTRCTDPNEEMFERDAIVMSRHVMEPIDEAAVDRYVERSRQEAALFTAWSRTTRTPRISDGVIGMGF